MGISVFSGEGVKELSQAFMRLTQEDESPVASLPAQDVQDEAEMVYSELDDDDFEGEDE
jgi:hypothetical protein